MQKHIKNYLSYYWVDNPDELRCEVCWMKATDIHHIKFRSSFWKNKKDEQDNIKNLIALCRFDHDKAHWIGNNGKFSAEELQEIHINNL